MMLLSENQVVASREVCFGSLSWKATLLQHIPDCLGSDRSGDDRIDELGDLDCII